MPLHCTQKSFPHHYNAILTDIDGAFTDTNTPPGRCGKLEGSISKQMHA
jgi:hypothetical protein